MKQLQHRWLRARRYPRSTSDNPRALREEARAVQAAAMAANHPLSRGVFVDPTSSLLSTCSVWLSRRSNLSDITWIASATVPRVTPQQAGAPRRHLVPLLLALTLVATSAGVVAAHPGDLDPSFGTGGTVTTPVGYASAVALQGDGKIVAAGHTDAGTRGAFALARYNPNGSLDATFGRGGTVTTAFGTSYDAAYEP